MIRTPGQIERGSMEIIRGELRGRGITLPPENEAVILRCIHASADFDYAANLCFTPGAVLKATEALRGGTDIVTDTNMALAGISKPGLQKLGASAHCYMAEAFIAERAKAQAAADELARVEATKAIREAETMKLKYSINELQAEKLRYEELNAELVEYQKELDERERALRPEKTIADLSWLPDEDTEVDENGKAHPRKKVKMLPENDPNLPKETRELAKAERIRAQADDILKEDARARVVAPLEKLYVAAVKEGRTVDAEYYRLVLKSMYPDWEFKGENNE